MERKKKKDGNDLTFYVTTHYVIESRNKFTFVFSQISFFRVSQNLLFRRSLAYADQAHNTRKHASSQWQRDAIDGEFDFFVLFWW